MIDIGDAQQILQTESWTGREFEFISGATNGQILTQDHVCASVPASPNTRF